MCKNENSVSPEPVNKYRVSGSVNKFESLETNSIEEALAFAAGLVQEGYSSVVISDNEAQGVW